VQAPASTLFAASVIVGVLALVALARAPAPASVARSVHSLRPAPTPEAARLRDGEPLDLNRAAIGDLVLLPGVGPKLAARIVEERERLAGFESVEQLGAVKGVGPKKLAQLKMLVSVGARDPAAMSR
jgi:competence protein ComEA